MRGQHHGNQREKIIKKEEVVKCQMLQRDQKSSDLKKGYLLLVRQLVTLE